MDSSLIRWLCFAGLYRTATFFALVPAGQGNCGFVFAAMTLCLYWLQILVTTRHLAVGGHALGYSKNKGGRAHEERDEQ